VASFKNIVKQVTCALGADHAVRSLNRSKLLICCYHGVRRDDDPTRHWLMLSREAFVEQMRYLHAHYRCLPLEDALQELDRGPLASPVACVTFDDGYLNNRTVAFPVLQELDIPATIYVATGMLGSRRALWTTRLDLSIAQSEGRTLHLEALNMGPITIDSVVAPTIARALVARLKSLSAAERGAALEDIEAQLNSPVIPSTFDFMSWEDACALDASGLVRIAAHTVNHEILSQLSDADVAYEITESMNEVSTRLGHASATFAYPNGTTADFDERGRRVLQLVGCVAALSTREGLNSVDEDRFALRRIVVGGAESIQSFRLRCAGISRAH
jgi:peptidoglycan/xylan/chitin deacetylase (PgdA/CDA1 family)